MDEKLIKRFCSDLPSTLQRASAPIDVASLKILSPGDGVADATAKVEIRDHHGKKIAVVLCSSPVSPNMVARGMGRAHDAKEALDPELGAAILTPISQGWWQDLSYAVLPYCDPLDGRWQRFRFRSSILGWLRKAVVQTLTMPTAEEVEESFRRPLVHLGNSEGVPEAVQRSAKKAVMRLDQKIWRPRQAFMHGDFHLGNVLHATKGAPFSVGWGRQRLVIIDWPGSFLRGQAVYDLIRAASSLKLRRKQLVHELAEYARILDCAVEDLRSYLGSALGALGMQLEHFPKSAYIRMLQRCYSTLPD